MLFNIFINDLFPFVSNSHLSNYVDEDTLYVFRYKLEKTNNMLHFYFELVLKWFEEYYTVLNVDKCHFMCLGKDTKNQKLIFHNFIFNNSNKRENTWDYY